MSAKSTALRLGLQIVQSKLGQALGDPGFSVFTGNPVEQSQATELPTTPNQVRDRSAKIKPPRVVTSR